MTTYAAVIKAAIPDADDGTVDHVLWGRTPYPVGDVTAKSLFRAASAYRRACEHGIHLCDWCHRPAQPGTDLCAGCDAALHQERK